MDRSPSGDVGDFYLRGDIGYHHGDDDLVRKYAVEASVWPNSIFPDNVSDVVWNIYFYINALLGYNDPGDADIDSSIAFKIDRGLLRPHPGPAKDEYHICISHAYLFGSFARTVGVPAREIDLGLGVSIKQVDQKVFGVWYTQTAAVEVWFDNDWRLFDTALDITCLDGYDGYFKVSAPDPLLKLKPCIKYRSWYSYDRRYTTMPDMPWLGHDFWIDPLFGHPRIFSGWKHLQDDVKKGVVIVIASPVYSYLLSAQGNKTGYIEGNILQEIPESYYLPGGSRFSTNEADSTAYWEADETIFVAGSGQPEDYSLVITGTDDGHYQLILAYVHEDGIIDGSTIGCDIGKDETHTYGISVTAAGEITFTKIPGHVDIDPDTLNLESKGKWITCYIELPEGFDVSQIDGSTVTADDVPAYIGKEGWATAEATTSNILDHDGDGRPERMVKFDKSAIQNAVELGEVTLAVSGDLIDGTRFEGSDTITVIDKGKKKESKGKNKK